MFRCDLKPRSSCAILLFFVCLAILFAATGCGQEEPDKSPSAVQAPEQAPVQAPEDKPKEAIFAIFKEARDRAKAEGKLVMVELYDETCEWCDAMEEETFSDSAVVKALEDFVHVRITPERDSLVKAFKLRMSPAFVFFKPDMYILKPPLQGFRSPEVFLAELENYQLRARGEEPKSVPEDAHPSFGMG